LPPRGIGGVGQSGNLIVKIDGEMGARRKWRETSMRHDKSPGKAEEKI